MKIHPRESNAAPPLLNFYLAQPCHLGMRGAGAFGLPRIGRSSASTGGRCDRTPFTAAEQLGTVDVASAATAVAPKAATAKASAANIATSPSPLARAVLSHRQHFRLARTA